MAKVSLQLVRSHSYFTTGVFAVGVYRNLYDKNASKSLHQCQQGLRLLILPLFASLFENSNAIND